MISIAMTQNEVHVLVLPFPDLLQELFTPVVMSSVALSLDQSCLNNSLCGDTSVIVTGSKKDGVALHTFPDNQRLHRRK